MDRLKLMALDADDLAVISAQVQDAVTKPEAIDYNPRAHRFTLVVNRFAWDAENRASRSAAAHERRQAALSRLQVLSLLAIRFVERDAPAGTIELVFADGPLIHLDVECVEAQLEDLGAAWETRFKPRHP